MESNQLPPHLHGLIYLLETLRMKLQGCRCQFVDFFCPGLTISTTIWWICKECVDTHDPDFRDPHFLPLVPPWGCYFFFRSVSWVGLYWMVFKVCEDWVDGSGYGTALHLICWFWKHTGVGPGCQGCCLWCAWEPVSFPLSQDGGECHKSAVVKSGHSILLVQGRRWVSWGRRAHRPVRERC